jgi:hypothetical protein
MTIEGSAANLVADPGSGDLAAKVGGAWRDFAGALADALPAMPAGARLTLTLDPTATGTGEATYDVVVRLLGGGESERPAELHADAIGNAALPEEYRLTRSAIGDLVALGWSPPGVVEGSGDRFGLRLPIDDAPEAAAIITRTLRDVYGTPHPAFLTYTVHGDSVVPALAAARPLAAGTVLAVRPTPGTVDVSAVPLAERVLTVVAELLKTDPDALQIDDEGEISIRSGSAMVFVRIHSDPSLIDVYSPILTEVEPDERLYERLSQLTRRMPIGRLYCTDDTVWASVPVFGRDFQATHLMLAVQVMTRLADELDDRLQGDFGGKRFFGEGDKGGPRQERTGMYL